MYHMHIPGALDEPPSRLGQVLRFVLGPGCRAQKRREKLPINVPRPMKELGKSRLRDGRKRMKRNGRLLWKKCGRLRPSKRTLR